MTDPETLGAAFARAAPACDGWRLRQVHSRGYSLTVRDDLVLPLQIEESTGTMTTRAGRSRRRLCRDPCAGRRWTGRGRERRLLADPGSYGQRSLSATLLPGVMVDGLRLVLYGLRRELTCHMIAAAMPVRR